MKSENYLLRWYNTEIQIELILFYKILNIQLEIDSLREQISKLNDENARFRDKITSQDIEKQNESNIKLIYSNTDQFIINYISLCSENTICKQINCATLYQEYLAWCEDNRKKPLTNTVAEKKFSQISINRTRL